MTSTSAPTKPPIRWTNLIVLAVPPVVSLTVVPWYGFKFGYDSFEWLWFFLLLCFCEMSITGGYHRLWSHKAYKANPVVKFIFALGGACALQNDCITWASDHRRHHLHADDNDRDPYSAGKGFWYSHFGWMIRDYESTRSDTSNVKDLFKEPVLVWQRKYYLALLLAMNLGLPLVLGLIHGDIWGSLLLAGFLRLTLSQHFTYLVNSAAHYFGKRPYDPKQTARDNSLVAVLTFGEGYHNYHHTFAWDYRCGIKWYHWDPTKWMIRLLAWLGLARDLRSCSYFRQEKARADAEYHAVLSNYAKLPANSKWRQQLEQEYQAFCQTLHHWAETRQQWYQAKSSRLSAGINEKLHDLEALKQRYENLKIELRYRKKCWQAYLDTFPALCSEPARIN